MMCSRLFAILLCVSLLVTACGRQAVPEAEETSPATLVTVMTFNVENLFDNVDDPDKNDQTFLPIEAKQSEPTRWGRTE